MNEIENTVNGVGCDTATIIQGKNLFKRNVDRKQTYWQQELRKWYSCTVSQLFRVSATKNKTAIMITNLPKGESTQKKTLL